MTDPADKREPRAKWTDAQWAAVLEAKNGLGLADATALSGAQWQQVSSAAQIGMSAQQCRDKWYHEEGKKTPSTLRAKKRWSSEHEQILRELVHVVAARKIDDELRWPYIADLFGKRVGALVGADDLMARWNEIQAAEDPVAAEHQKSKAILAAITEMRTDMKGDLAEIVNMMQALLTKIDRVIPDDFREEGGEDSGNGVMSDGDMSDI